MARYKSARGSTTFQKATRTSQVSDPHFIFSSQLFYSSLIYLERWKKTPANLKSYILTVWGTWTLDNLGILCTESSVDASVHKDRTYYKSQQCLHLNVALFCKLVHFHTVSHMMNPFHWLVCSLLTSRCSCLSTNMRAVAVVLALAVITGKQKLSIVSIHFSKYLFFDVMCQLHDDLPV